jgi:tRNA pseudouridine13 synthase
MALLRRERACVRNPFLKKLALSAAQSLLFNDYLARRLNDGLMRTVLAGDVLAKCPAGGMFVARDLAAEQPRLDAREVVPAGPMFGRKLFPTEGDAAKREAAVLADAQLTTESFAGFGKLLAGARRHNLVYVDDLSATAEPEGLRLTFTLPAGSYATVLLRELMKVNTELVD